MGQPMTGTSCPFEEQGQEGAERRSGYTGQLILLSRLLVVLPTTPPPGPPASPMPSVAEEIVTGRNPRIIGNECGTVQDSVSWGEEKVERKLEVREGQPGGP